MRLKTVYSFSVKSFTKNTKLSNQTLVLLKQKEKQEHKECKALLDFHLNEKVGKVLCTGCEILD